MYILGKLLPPPLWTQFWPMTLKKKMLLKFPPLAAPIRPSSFPQGCELDAFTEIWSIAVSEGIFFLWFLSSTSQILPALGLPRSKLPNKAVIYSLFLTLPSESRSWPSGSILGQKGPRLLVDVFTPPPPFHFFFLMWGESEWLELVEKRLNEGLLPPLPSSLCIWGCWVILQDWVCWLFQGFWKMWRGDPGRWGFSDTAS